MSTAQATTPAGAIGMRPDIAVDTVTRNARTADLPQLLDMVCLLARHHHDTPELTLEQLRALIFGPDKWISVIVAEQIPGTGPGTATASNAGTPPVSGACVDTGTGTSLAGYAALCPRIQLQLGLRGIDLHHLFVRDGMRGQGVGSHLVKAAEKMARARGCSYMTVSTHPENITAQHIYLAQGFTRLPGAGNRFQRSLDLD
ncbi:GNAT family N-acetyltransferase [Candidatus Halocynthiibacter alkanivorans]|uniref:GNAT family N-acetyltransferase n=1 Tax=Candidatus Halocynthiibacter alkanivorans TaxID=2267619 RepID=UPI001356F368|nr:GNAT family N-acetyltransferase [Candidatus Halocynthiibacter alkanivorans]